MTHEHNTCPHTQQRLSHNGEKCYNVDFRVSFVRLKLKEDFRSSSEVRPKEVKPSPKAFLEIIWLETISTLSSFSLGSSLFPKIL